VAVGVPSNAVKFTPEGARITLAEEKYTGPRQATEEAEGGAGALFDFAGETFVHIAIEDAGIGIPDEKLKKIFDRILKVDSSSMRVYGSTGLGLSIVQSFIEGHGAVAFAETEVGKGSKVIQLRPRAEYDARQRNTPSSSTRFPSESRP